jgi:hypothetical protein
MQISQLSRDGYPEWDSFCLASDDAWFWHTSDFIEYTLNLRPNLRSQSKSFIVLDGGEVLAASPVFIEAKEFDNWEYMELSFGGDYCPAPALKNGLSEHKREEVLKAVFDHVDELARELGARRASFRLTPTAKSFLCCRRVSFNYLMKYGFFDNSLNTQVIDLSLPETELKKAVRKGHKYDIGRGARDYVISTYDSENITRDIFEQYRLLHHRAAGRVTRPLITFEMMHDWIKKGKAILVGAQCRGRHVAFSLCIVYKEAAYYGSAADDPDFEANVPVSHAIQWETMMRLKRAGIKYYEIGLQQYGCQIYDQPSQKDMGISFFKRGFGGVTVPCFRGEKFYDPFFMRRVFSSRLESVITGMPRKTWVKGSPFSAL